MRYVGPFEIVERVGPVAYRLRLPQELAGIHVTFHVSNLKKFLVDVNLHVPLEEIKIDNRLHFVEDPIEIMDREGGTREREVKGEGYDRGKWEEVGRKREDERETGWEWRVEVWGIEKKGDMGGDGRWGVGVGGKRVAGGGRAKGNRAQGGVVQVSVSLLIAFTARTRRNSQHVLRVKPKVIPDRRKSARTTGRNQD
ncbi:hypothetical protein Tco_0246964 [Tanacetum coccineum]